MKKGVWEAKIAFQCLSDSIDIFEQEIINNKFLPKGGTVSLYIYDKGTGNLVTEQVVSNSALKKYKGATVTLDPGIYEIRCWANVDAGTIIYGEEKLATARLSNRKYYPNHEVVISDDPLYYGAATLTVPSDGFVPETIADTLSFRMAHIHFDIAFAGGNGVIPKVEIKNLEPAFNFEMQKAGSRISYFPEIKIGKTAVATHMRAEFNILRTAYKNAFVDYDNTNDIEIVIKDFVADTLIYSIGLKEWMETYGIKVNPSLDNKFISIPDSLFGKTSGISSLPSILIKLGDSASIPVDTIPTIPIDTIPTIPVDTIPPMPSVPDINNQGLFFHLYRINNGYYDLFEEQIESVNVYVYEKLSGNRIQIPKDILLKDDLNSFQGLRLSLPPINQSDTTSKEYEIRCWANVGANTTISEQQHLISGSVANVNYSKANTIKTNDMLYFGQAAVKVTSDYTYVTEKINFNTAYTRFSISVKGLGSSDTLPKIKVSGLPSSYDFFMDNQQWPSKDYYPEIVTTATDTMFVFNSFRLTSQRKDDVVITLEHPRISKHTIKLKDRGIMIDDQKTYNYIYVKGMNTTNTIRVAINVGDSVVDNIW